MFTAFGWRKIPSARTLSIMIFLAGLGLTASVISLLYLSQHLIASKSNEIDQQRSVLSVEGAVQTSVNRVLSLVLDNAIWDDAVTQTYAPRLDQNGCTTPGDRASKSITCTTAPLSLMNIITFCGAPFRVR